MLSVLPELQAALRRYLAGGGGLFASGSYVAADLWAEGTPEEGRAFAREVLRIDFDGGHPSERGRVRVMTSDTSFSRGEYRFNTEYRRDRYVVERADALKPAGAGAFAVMRYDDSGRTAAVACDADGGHVALDILHGVVDGHTRRHRAAGAVDVHLDVLVGVLCLQIQQLCHHQTGCGIIDLFAQEDDAVIEQPGENVVGTLAPVGLLHNIRN